MGKNDLKPPSFPSSKPSYSFPEPTYDHHCKLFNMHARQHQPTECWQSVELWLPSPPFFCKQKCFSWLKKAGDRGMFNRGKRGECWLYFFFFATGSRDWCSVWTRYERGSLFVLHVSSSDFAFLHYSRKVHFSLPLLMGEMFGFPWVDPPKKEMQLFFPCTGKQNCSPVQIVEKKSW